jgi:hypothetical protein
MNEKKIILIIILSLSCLSHITRSGAWKGVLNFVMSRRIRLQAAAKYQEPGHIKLSDYRIEGTRRVNLAAGPRKLFSR